MAKGFTERKKVQDRNTPNGGNAPAQQLAVGGIQGGQSAPAAPRDGLADALSAFGRIGDNLARKKTNADYIEGQMASMSGKTQEEVAKSGNKTTMAGFVSLEVGNAVSQWSNAQAEAAATDHYNTSPEEYSKHLSNSVSQLVSKMGGDDFAEEQLVKSLAPSMQRLAASQAAAHAQYTETETTNSYTTALIQSGQYSAQQYEGSATGPNGPVTGAFKSESDYRPFSDGIASTAPQSSASVTAMEMIREHEGFRTGTYWDVNAHRTGFGSDTITRADGSVVRVRKGDTVTREDAERDLTRRSAIFAKAARNKVGAANWDSLPPAAQAALTSVAYNYGSIPDRLDAAIASRDTNKIASAVARLGGDNKGINRKRRAKEAAVIRNSVHPLANPVNVAATSKALAADDLPVSAGNVYIAANTSAYATKRILQGHPDASVDTTLTTSEINANRDLLTEDGKLVTNKRLQEIAAEKAGDTERDTSSANVRMAVFANPGLPPQKHKQAVVGAVIQTLASGDGSLYQNAGGLQGLMKLNLSTAQVAQVSRAHKAFQKERQNEYNMEYERAKHNLLEEAGSGEYSDDEMFSRLAIMQTEFGQSDAELRRVHQSMQKTLDGANLGSWAEPSMQLELIQLKNDILDEKKDVEAAMQDVIELGKMKGVPEEETQKAVAQIMQAYDKVQAQERSTMLSTAKAGRKQLKTKAEAANLISHNVLGTGTKEQQAAGIALMEETLAEDLQESGLSPQDIPSKASEMMAKVLVQNDVIDEKRASAMRAAVANPINAEGKPNPRAIEALAFYMDLKHGANAQPEYFARMFSNNPKTLELLSTAEGHMIGDADLDTALLKAHDQVTNPVTSARIKEQHKKIANGEYQNAVKENIISNSGLSDTFWNNTMNLFNGNWSSEKLDEEGRNRIMQDAGLDLVIEEETRSAIALMPNATEETITQVVSGQMADRGTIMGSSFVMAPKGKTMRSVMGLNSSEPTAANEALVRYVEQNGKELFGAAVWEDLSPGLSNYLAAAADNLTSMNSISDSLRESGAGRPEFVVELVGDNFVIRPASEKYKFDDGVLWDDYASLPEAASAIVPAKAIGKFYNDYQTDSSTGVLTPLLNLFK